MTRATNPVYQAILHTLPLYEMMRMRAATAPRKHPQHGFAGQSQDHTARWLNTFTYSKRLLTPADRAVVAPNNDTVYLNTWLDLSDGPIVIRAPDMGERYWSLGFLDMWTNPFAYAGRRTTGNRAQNLFIHAPQWQGVVPEGMVEIAAPGLDLWVIGRILVDPTDEDLARVNALQQQFAILRADTLQAAAKKQDTLMDGRKTSVPNVAQYRTIVEAAWGRNPAPKNEAQNAQSLWREAVAAGDTDLQKALIQVHDTLRQNVRAAKHAGGWNVSVTLRTHWGDQIAQRARVARNGIGALGIEEAMYPMAEVDAQGQALDGAHRYALRFAPGAAPQVDAFWSLTMYRKSDCLLVDNPINRYSIGDRTPGLHWDADGGLSIFIQHDAPTDALARANWLPAPRAPFYLILRLYQPRATHLDFTFVYPPLIRLD